VEPVRVGVVGVGNMGYHHARVYSSLEKNGLVKLVGVVDADPQRARRVAEEFGTKAFTDYRGLLGEGVDAVSIAVPTRLHHEVALFFIRNNVHVLVEKPIADTVEKASEMIREAEKQGVILLVGHIERYNPAVRRLKEEIQEGVLGDIVTLSAKRIGPFDPRVSDVSIVIDLAIHDIDIMTYLTDSKPVKVYAKARKIYGNSKADDYAIILITFENGVDGIIETNRLTPYKLRLLNIVGVKGVAQLDYIEQKLVIYDNKYVRDALVKKDEPLKIEITHFIDCVNGQAKPLTPGVIGLNALQIAYAALDSSLRGEAAHI